MLQEKRNRKNIRHKKKRAEMGRTSEVVNGSNRFLTGKKKARARKKRLGKELGTTTKIPYLLSVGHDMRKKKNFKEDTWDDKSINLPKGKR